MSKVTVIGAGLAGCEAAWQLSNAGISMEIAFVAVAVQFTNAVILFSVPKST